MNMNNDADMIRNLIQEEENNVEEKANEIVESVYGILLEQAKASPRNNFWGRPFDDLESSETAREKLVAFFKENGFYAHVMQRRTRRGGPYKWWVYMCLPENKGSLLSKLTFTEVNNVVNRSKDHLGTMLDTLDGM